MRIKRLRKTVYGFTLLEVMIAVLVFSVGLLGVAGMVLLSMRSNHVAHLHTQATFLAQWMSDAMRANPVAVNNGDYDGVATAGDETCAEDNCDSATLAARDLAVWGTLVQRYLPNGAGTIACNLAPLPTGSLLAAPSGLCTIQLSWIENDDRSVGGQQRAQQFDWVFNP